MGVVVVGVDGSAAARQALRFAAEEASLRGAALRVVNAWLAPSFEGVPVPMVAGFPIEYGRPFEEVVADARAASAALIEREVAEVLGPEPGMEVEQVALEGRAAAVLVEASRDVELLVVGARGLGGFKELLLGSVSHQCAQHAACPVVIVRAAREN
jgi:nucleotide-binding universal stress UspA family protein